MGWGQSKQENVAVAQAQATIGTTVQSKLDYLSIIVVITAVLMAVIIICILRRRCTKRVRKWLHREVQGTSVPIPNVRAQAAPVTQPTVY